MPHQTRNPSCSLSPSMCSTTKCVASPFRSKINRRCRSHYTPTLFETADKVSTTGSLMTGTTAFPALHDPATT